MIFVTVGTQLPFPRLIQTVDDLAEGLSEDVVAQVGPDTTPRAHLSARPMLTPSEFDTLFRQARVIIGHAGIGTLRGPLGSILPKMARRSPRCYPRSFRHPRPQRPRRKAMRA